MIKQKNISPVLMWLIIATGVALIFFILPKTPLLGTEQFFSWLILPAAFYWLYFFSGAIKVHKQAAKSVAGIDQIIKEGVFAKVRHPIYSADIVLAWGIFFFMGDLRFLLGVIWLSLAMFYWMRLEEKGLTEKFGQEYLDYKKEAPMICPKFKFRS